MFDWSRVVPGYPIIQPEHTQPSSSDNDTPSDDSFFGRMDRKLGAILTPTTMEKVQESCPFVAIRNGIIGFGFGGILGLFISGMGSPPLDAAGVPEKITVRSVLREMASKTWSSAKNLGKVAVLFSTTECIIEGYRAKHDIYNVAFAGCISGGILGAKGGPRSALLGCAGFAAFSTAIEAYMNRH